MTADIALLLVLALLIVIGTVVSRRRPQPTTCRHGQDQATCFQCWADDQL